MTDKIQKAAEIIQHEVRKNVGAHISLEDAERLARQLNKLWSERVEVLNLPPGEVAQKLRERVCYSTEDIRRLYEGETEKQIREDLPAVSSASHYS